MRKSKYNIIISHEIHEPSINDDVVDFIGWDVMSLIIPEIIIRKNIFNVNWKAISSRLDLTNEFFLEFDIYLDWTEYLLSEKPKYIDLLVKNTNKVLKVSKVFNSDLVKKICYLDPEFIDAFPELVDWSWYGQNIKIPEYLIERYLPKYNHSIISASQNLTPALYEKCWNTLDWTKISKYQKLTEKLIYRWRHLVKWGEIFIYQKLSCKFIEQYKFNHVNSNKLIPEYQELTEKFIEDNINWLDISTVCLKQNMSFEFLQKYKKKWMFNILQHNIFYNKPGTIQILQNKKTEHYFIIPAYNEEEHTHFLKH
jgi:hypothetical protein